MMVCSSCPGDVRRELEGTKEGAPSPRRLSEEQFQQWVNRRSNLPLAVRGHSFVLRGDNVVVVDGGKFLYEEAVRLVKLLNSRNPFDQLNANLTIAERNGLLRLVVLGLTALIVVVALLLALR